MFRSHDGTLVAGMAFMVVAIPGLRRAAVRPWRTFDDDAMSVTLDPAHLELVRGYLAGETALLGTVPFAGS